MNLLGPDTETRVPLSPALSCRSLLPRLLLQASSGEAVGQGHGCGEGRTSSEVRISFLMLLLYLSFKVFSVIPRFLANFSKVLIAVAFELYFQ